MFTTRIHTGLSSSDHEVRSYMPIPTVYEQATVEQPQWEYHVLTIDTHEMDVPANEQFNKLGREGWIMTGLLDERATGRGTNIYYYFVRQLQAQQ
jgi:hypothetical protein